GGAPVPLASGAATMLRPLSAARMRSRLVMSASLKSREMSLPLLPGALLLGRGGAPGAGGADGGGGGSDGGAGAGAGAGRGADGGPGGGACAIRNGAGSGAPGASRGQGNRALASRAPGSAPARA